MLAFSTLSLGLFSNHFRLQAMMLYKTLEERGEVASEVSQVLEWAELNNVITKDQRDILLTEIMRRVHSKGNSKSQLLPQRQSLTR